VPSTTRVEIPPAEQARMLAAVRRARYGDLLALHLLLLCAAGRTPSASAAVRFCARSSVYRVVKAYRAGTLTFDDARVDEAGRARRRILTPSLKRSMMALLKTGPRAWGGKLTRLRPPRPPGREERPAVLQHKVGVVMKPLSPKTRSSFAPNYRRFRSLRLRAGGLQRLATTRRTAADRHAARCASRDLCSGGAPRRYPPSEVAIERGPCLYGSEIPKLCRPFAIATSKDSSSFLLQPRSPSPTRSLHAT
jgi:hypothetical protein